MQNSEASDLIRLAKRIPELDAEYAIGLTGGSEPLYEKTLRAVIRHLPASIGHMDVHILEGGNLGEFAVKAHGLKSSLKQIGCLRLAKLAGALEKAAKSENRPYCSRHYGAFRDELLRFYSLLSEAALRGPEPGFIVGSDENAPFEIISLARKAALEFDALNAADILAQLLGRGIGANENALISKAVEALNTFKHKQALAYIDELLETYENPAAYHTGEDVL